MLCRGYAAAEVLQSVLKLIHYILPLHLEGVDFCKIGCLVILQLADSSITFQVPNLSRICPKENSGAYLVVNKRVNFVFVEVLLDVCGYYLLSFVVGRLRQFGDFLNEIVVTICFGPIRHYSS